MSGRLVGTGRVARRARGAATRHEAGDGKGLRPHQPPPGAGLPAARIDHQPGMNLCAAGKREPQAFANRKDRCARQPVAMEDRSGRDSFVPQQGVEQMPVNEPFAIGALGKTGPAQRAPHRVRRRLQRPAKPLGGEQMRHPIAQSFEPRPRPVLRLAGSDVSAPRIDQRHADTGARKMPGRERAGGASTDDGHLVESRQSLFPPPVPPVFSRFRAGVLSPSAI